MLHSPSARGLLEAGGITAGEGMRGEGWRVIEEVSGSADVRNETGKIAGSRYGMSSRFQNKISNAKQDGWMR